MPILKNAKHEQFAQNVAAGMGVAEAYKAAGGTAKTYNSISQTASHMKSHPLVSARIEELLQERKRKHEKASEKAIEKMALTREYVLSRLMENAERAMQAIPVKNKQGEDVGVYRYEGSVANRALELLGKELGLFVDRKEVGAPGEFAELDAASLREAIHQRLGLAGPGDSAPKVSGREGGLRGGSSSVH